ncbi:hypothetical protein ACP70R_046775 [Stipagrostis hirtigluma subsp. patula]
MPRRRHHHQQSVAAITDSVSLAAADMGAIIGPAAAASSGKARRVRRAVHRRCSPEQSSPTPPPRRAPGRPPAPSCGPGASPKTQAIGARNRTPLRGSDHRTSSSARPLADGRSPSLSRPLADGSEEGCVFCRSKRLGCSTSLLDQAGDRNIGHLQTNSANRVVAPQYACNNEDIDESSAKGLRSAESYAKANEMLIRVKVLGTKKTFWRLSDKATRISRKLALILRSHHAVGKYLTAPLQVSNVWIGSSGYVKLRDVSFTNNHFSIERVRDDYKHLSKVLQALIRISGGDTTKLPPDYKEFLTLLRGDTLTMKDEFLIVNNSALLPMKNRTDVFLMLYDRIVTSLGREPPGRAKKKRILSKLPYKNNWLETAVANKQINQWVVKKIQYKRTPLDLLRLNRNVRSHLHRYNDDDIEEILYCEWPELLMVMVKMLHVEGVPSNSQLHEKTVEDGEGTAAVVRSMSEKFDLLIVGRRGGENDGMEGSAALTSGLSEWSECPELGVLGDMLATAEFASKVSIVVIQQQPPKNATAGAGNNL